MHALLTADQDIKDDEEFDVMLDYAKTTVQEKVHGKQVPVVAKKTPKFLSHMFAAEEDAISLVWMGKTAFG